MRFPSITLVMKIDVYVLKITCHNVADKGKGQTDYVDQ